MNRNKVE